MVLYIAAGSTSEEIQAIVDQAEFGTIIEFEAGEYRFTSTVEISTDGVTIRGAPDGQTVITLASSMKGDAAFQVGPELFSEDLGAAIGVVSGEAGGTSLTLQSADGISVGDVLWIETPNTQELFDEIGDTAWQKDKPLQTQMVVVSAIDGDTVSFEKPLQFSYDTAASVKLVDTVDNVTISDLTLMGDYGVSDPTDFSNTIKAEDDGMMILVNTSQGFRLENVTMIEPGSNGLVLAKSIGAEVEGLSVTGAHNKGDSGNGYGLWIRDVYDSSFTDLNIVDTRHAVLFASYTSASGNVVEVTYTNRDINFHGGLDQDNQVTVLNSLRDTAAEQEALGLTVFFNEGGKRYGPPTDRDANTVLFTNVEGSVRAEEVALSDEGGTAYMHSSSDTVIGGAGDDFVDAGTGSDVMYVSAGTDRLIGNSGSDTVVFAGGLADLRLVQEESGLWLYHTGGATLLETVELLQTDDDVFSLRDDLAYLLASGGYSGAAVEEPAVGEPDIIEIVDPVEEDPVAETPEVEEPVAEDPVLEEPEVEEPEVDEPEVDEPEVAEPVAEVPEEPVTEDPVPEEPVAEEPVAEDPPVESPPETGESSKEEIIADPVDSITFKQESDADILGTSGKDSLKLSKGETVAFGAGGNDKVKAASEDSYLDLGAGDDKGTGASGHDTIIGAEGDDTIRGNKGEDVLYGGDGDDILYGNNDDDVLYGGAGDDKLNAGSGSATLEGGAGSDKFIISDGENFVLDFSAEEGDRLYMNGHSDSEIFTAALAWSQSGVEGADFSFSLTENQSLSVTHEGVTTTFEGVTLDILAEWYSGG